MKLPNILWIQTDEQRVDSLGCYGSSWAKTPHVDRLAAEGVLFRNCFCPSPVCVPSRSSQLAARYPQECNTVINATGPFPAGTITFPEFLASCGYRTINFGKSHTPPHPTWQESQDIRIFEKYATCRNLGPDLDEKQFRVVHPPGEARIIISGVYPGGDDHPSAEITNLAIAFLREHKGPTPFCLRVSHNWPHSPVLPPQHFGNLYQPGDIPIRFFDEDAYKTRPQRYRDWADAFGLARLDAEVYARTWTDYMGLCACVDNQVGRLLDELEACGLADDTIVIFSSDHGRALGEWGAAEKHVFDQAVWRVPFIVRWPGHLPAGTCREDLCNLIDTARTLAGMNKLLDTAPKSWRGRALFTDTIPAPEAQTVFGQIGLPDSRIAVAEARAEQANSPVGYAMAGAVMRVAVRDTRYRLDIDWMAEGRRFSQDQMNGLLFDLETDPLERHNLFYCPEHAATVDRLIQNLELWFDDLAQPNTLFSNSSVT